MNTFEMFFPGHTNALPVIHFVGDTVHLSCHNPSGSAHEATWDRSGGLPNGHHVDHGVLVLPAVHKQDEGVYNCVVAGEEKQQHISEVDLQVDDFVPDFHGVEPIEFAPLTDDQLRQLDVVVTLNTTADQGILFSTQRENENGQPIVLHEARIREGVVRYEYDVGYGRGKHLLGR
ncbi:unnamed protein product [Caenorhabditis auriculariae]|uniref:Ig-like domain-containing protein n=1 Tax=Caenorhabditis auriculariae TaxID=2777116 RepID=A0A8S1HPP3_9PELO|nr:unnamed protein product [Caenorhabditis auriculariae]